jgi:hypothetical protein
MKTLERRIYSLLWGIGERFYWLKFVWTCGRWRIWKSFAPHFIQSFRICYTNYNDKISKYFRNVSILTILTLSVFQHLSTLMLATFSYIDWIRTCLIETGDSIRYSAVKITDGGGCWFVRLKLGIGRFQMILKSISLNRISVIYALY